MEAVAIVRLALTRKSTQSSLHLSSHSFLLDTLSTTISTALPLSSFLPPFGLPGLRFRLGRHDLLVLSARLNLFLVILVILHIVSPFEGIAIRVQPREDFLEMQTRLRDRLRQLVHNSLRQGSRNGFAKVGK